MTAMVRRLALPVAILCGAALTGGCTRVRTHQGYVADKALIATISPGVDNRASVERTLGRPSFAGEFDPDRSWYYVSRDTRQFSFGTPKPVAQSVLIVHFDPAGNVSSVEHTGLEKIARIDPVRDKTPTLGRKANFFRDLFTNVGTGAPAGAGAPTSDNPGQ